MPEPIPDPTSAPPRLHTAGSGGVGQAVDVVLMAPDSTARFPLPPPSPEASPPSPPPLTTEDLPASDGGSITGAASSGLTTAATKLQPLGRKSRGGSPDMNSSGARLRPIGGPPPAAGSAGAAAGGGDGVGGRGEAIP